MFLSCRIAEKEPGVYSRWFFVLEIHPRSPIN